MPASSLFALENIITQRIEQSSQNPGDSDIPVCCSGLVDMHALAVPPLKNPLVR